jgi:CRP-like cAMP-binding protein
MHIESILQDIPLFQSVPENLLAIIAHDTHAHQLKKGAVLFHQGAPVTGFYYVLEGCFKLSVSSPNGHEKVIEIIREGMSFGEAVVFIEQPYPVTAEALANSLVLHIPHELVLKLAREHSDFALKMLAGVSRRLHLLIKDMEHLCLYSATQRVLGFLLTEAHSINTRSKHFSFTLPASKKIIAARLNLTPETLSRILHQFSKDNLLSIKGQLVTIHDFEKLKQLEI